MVADFSSKLNFEPRQVKFIEKVYTLKTDHKTGLLLQKLYSDKNAENLEQKIVKLTLGDTQYKEFTEEFENAGKAGSENYMENMVAVMCAIMSVMYNKPYEYFEEAMNKALKK